jgi:thioredoxin 1
VDRLSQDPRFAKVAVYQIDFDSSKEVLRGWKVSQQSTLLAFKGKTERMRSTAVTKPDGIQKIFEAAL